MLAVLPQRMMAVTCPVHGDISITLNGCQVRQLNTTEMVALLFVCPDCGCTDIRTISPAERDILITNGVPFLSMPFRDEGEAVEMPDFRHGDGNGHYMLSTETGIDMWADRVAVKARGRDRL